MATYSISSLGRREIMLMSAVAASFGLSGWALPARAETKLRRTPEQILGPFYPLSDIPQTTDLTRPPGRSGRAEGQLLNVMGKVLNLAGEPVRNAKVEIWQANSHGRYTHPSDPNPAPLDSNFDGFAVLATDADGRYRFTTIKPAAYPTGPNSMRPAHIHFQVTGKQDRLVTQLYFEGDPYNATDPFLNSAGRKEALITKVLDPTPDLEAGSKLVMFDIVIYKG
jgi:protocatechuate 3,4-dioxygenase beta subunit